MGENVQNRPKPEGEMTTKGEPGGHERVRATNQNNTKRNKQTNQTKQKRGKALTVLSQSKETEKEEGKSDTGKQDTQC